jgi:hypothetical protein
MDCCLSISGKMAARIAAPFFPRQACAYFAARNSIPHYIQSAMQGILSFTPEKEVASWPSISQRLIPIDSVWDEIKIME